MINIILTVVIIIALIASIVILRGFYLQKKAYDEVLINLMKNHESFITVQKAILKEFKTRCEDISKIEKDINTIRTGIKNLLEDLRSKIKSLTDKKEK